MKSGGWLGPTPSVLVALAAQAPSLRSASKLLSQLVEPGVPVSPTTYTKQKSPAFQRGFVVWYQWPDSNRHAFKGGGF